MPWMLRHFAWVVRDWRLEQLPRLPTLPVPRAHWIAEDRLRKQPVRSAKNCGLSWSWLCESPDASPPCGLLLGSTCFSVSLGLARAGQPRLRVGRGIGLRSAHMVLVNLVEHRAIAYSQQTGGSLPVPTSFSESGGDCVSLGLPLNALDQRLQRCRYGRARNRFKFFLLARRLSEVQRVPVRSVAIARGICFQPAQCEFLVASD